MKPSLKEYQRKRDFKHTTEPSPEAASKSKPESPNILLEGQSYVIQKHDASHLHYDLRLEMEGVLKSWAVPKGIPVAHGEKHLAVEVEDHPLDYADFEGTIPAGQYGGGTVMVWDYGHYELMGGEPLGAFKAGMLHLLFHGQKLNGEWTLVRTAREASKPQWLLLKTGEAMKSIPAKTFDRSAKTGRSMDEIVAGKGGTADVWESDRIGATPAAREHARRKAARQRDLPNPESVAVMKPVLVENVPTDSEQWLYEMKFDGYRGLALKRGDEVNLISATGKPLKFPDIAASISALGCGTAVLDGEIVALDEQGRPSFQLLQNAREGNVSGPICYYAFDLLQLEGKNLQSLTLTERKAQLSKLLAASPADETIRFSANLEGDPAELLAAIRRLGLEGVVAKQRASKYEPGRRSGVWEKIKVINEQEFVIGGYTPPEGSRKHFGSVLLGYHERGELRFAAKAGSGFSVKSLAEFYEMFQPLRRKDCPFVNLPAKREGRWGQGITAARMRQCTWLEPRLVCQIRFSEWTEDGGLRHPVFLGLREDKAAGHVVREMPKGIKTGASSATSVSSPTPAQRGRPILKPAPKRPRK